MFKIFDRYVFKTEKVGSSEITENIGAAVKTDDGIQLEFNIDTGKWEYADNLPPEGD